MTEELERLAPRRSGAPRKLRMAGLSDDGPVSVRAHSYLQSLENKPIDVAELSQRAIAVKNGLGDVEVYFNTRNYVVINEELWKPSEGESPLSPSVLEAIGLGVLPRDRHSPRVQYFGDALELAKTELKPISKEATFYDKPRPLNPEMASKVLK